MWPICLWLVIRRTQVWLAKHVNLAPLWICSCPMELKNQGCCIRSCSILFNFEVHACLFGWRMSTGSTLRTTKKQAFLICSQSNGLRNKFNNQLQSVTLCCSVWRSHNVSCVVWFVQIHSSHWQLHNKQRSFFFWCCQVPPLRCAIWWRGLIFLLPFSWQQTGCLFFPASQVNWLTVLFCVPVE